MKLVRHPVSSHNLNVHASVVIRGGIKIQNQPRAILRALSYSDFTLGRNDLSDLSLVSFVHTRLFC